MEIKSQEISQVQEFKNKTKIIIDHTQAKKKAKEIVEQNFEEYKKRNSEFVKPKKAAQKNIVERIKEALERSCLTTQLIKQSHLVQVFSNDYCTYYSNSLDMFNNVKCIRQPVIIIQDHKTQDISVYSLDETIFTIAHELHNKKALSDLQFKVDENAGWENFSIIENVNNEYLLKDYGKIISAEILGKVAIIETLNEIEEGKEKYYILSKLTYHNDFKCYIATISVVLGKEMIEHFSNIYDRIEQLKEGKN